MGDYVALIHWIAQVSCSTPGVAHIRRLAFRGGGREMSTKDTGSGPKPDHRFDDFGCGKEQKKHFVPEYPPIGLNSEIQASMAEYRPVLLSFLRENYPKGTIYYPTFPVNRVCAQMIREKGKEKRQERLRNLLEECCLEMAWSVYYEDKLSDPALSQRVIVSLKESQEEHNLRWDMALDLTICLLNRVILGSRVAVSSVLCSKRAASDLEDSE